MAQRFKFALSILLVGSSGAWPFQEPHGTALPSLRGSKSSNADVDHSEFFTIRLTTIWDLCLELPEGLADGGLRLLECTGKREQQWVYDTASQKIQAMANKSRCIDAGNAENAKLVTISPCKNSKQQRWSFDMANYGLVEGASASQRMVFDASENGRGTAVVLGSSGECWTQSLRVVLGAADTPLLTTAWTAKHELLDRLSKLSRAELSCLQSLFAPTKANHPGELLQVRCSDESQHGWPRFDTRAELENSPEWRTYFIDVYGEVPAAGYPICAFDLWHINGTAYNEARITTHPLITDKPQPGMDFWHEGDYLEWNVNEKWNGSGFNLSAADMDWYSGTWIFHSYRKRAYAADNTWVEVIHTAGGATGESIGMWLFYAPGSGIWFNTGKTRVFSTHELASYELCGYNCSTFIDASCDDKIAQCARDHGLDSIQFEFTMAYSDVYYEIIATNFIGAYACGTEDGGELNSASWRSGWQASQGCNCDNNFKGGVLNCQ